jgi:hypothetical protein
MNLPRVAALTPLASSGGEGLGERRPSLQVHGEGHFFLAHFGSEGEIIHMNA